MSFMANIDILAEFLTALTPEGSRTELLFVDPGTDKEAEAQVDPRERDVLKALLERYVDHRVYVLPISGDGKARFVAGVLKSRAGMEWTGIRAPLALEREGQVIAFWPLAAEEEADEEFYELMQLNGIEPGEPLPLPGTNGWSLLSMDAARSFHKNMLSSWLLTAGEDGPVARCLQEAPRVEARLSGAEFLCEDSEDLNKALVFASVGSVRQNKAKKEEHTVRQLLSLCAVHRIRKRKDGTAYIFADLIEGARKRSAARAMPVLGLDVDGGATLEEVDEAVRAFGKVAVRYTTHSHGKTETLVSQEELRAFAQGSEIDDVIVQAYLREKKGWREELASSASYLGQKRTADGMFELVGHDPIDKCRIVFPLAEAYRPDADAETLKEGLRNYPALLSALAECLGLSEAIDRSATDPTRLFYVPAAKAGAMFSSAIFAGELLDWRELNATISPTGQGAGPRGKTATEEGKALGRWSRYAAEGFQLADVIRACADDRIRDDQGSQLVIECPFDELHSNAGDPDDMACIALNASDGTSSPLFIATCHHNSCQSFNHLDMLAKMIADGWFAIEELCREDNLSAEIDEADLATARLSLIDESEHRALVNNHIQTLKKGASAEILERSTALLAATGLSDIEIDQALSEIGKRTGTGKRLLKEQFKRQSKAITRSAAAQESLVGRLRKPCGAELELPRVYGRDIILREHEDGSIWFHEVQEEDGQCKAICTPFEIVGAFSFPDRKGERALILNIFKREGEWSEVELRAREMIGPREIKNALYDKGLVAQGRGWQFLSDYLMSVPMTASPRYHRPGFRDGAFITPGGETLVGDSPAGLASEARLKCEIRAGAFEDWRAGAQALFALDGADHLQAGLLMGWVGPMVDLLGNDPVAYSIEGKTSTGKSTLQKLAASAWADPRLGKQGLFHSGRGTSNSNETLLESASGTLAAIDEFGRMPARDQEEIVFMLQSGVGKRRMGSQNERRFMYQWGGTALILSAETAFVERLKLAGEQPAGGLAARVITIATDEARQLTKAEWVSSVECIEKNFGWSGPAFVTALGDQSYVEDPRILEHRWRELTEMIAGEDLSPLERRAAGILAYLPLAGEIAQNAELLNGQFDMIAFARSLWENVLSSGLAPEDPVKKAADLFAECVFANKGTRIVHIDDQDHHGPEKLGYYGAELPSGEGVYVVRASACAELSGGTVPDKVLRAYLEECGVLVADPKTEYRTWSGFPKLGKTQYVVLRASAIESDRS